MAGRNWLGTFGGTNSFNVNSELDRGYEAALLIQSLELEYYGDRPIRPVCSVRLVCPGCPICPI